MTSPPKFIATAFVLLLFASVARADSAVIVIGGSKGKELLTVSAAARDGAERGQWTVLDPKLPSERVDEIIKCASTDERARCVNALLDQVSADRLVLLKLADEQSDGARGRVVYGSILRRGADMLAIKERHCEKCRDEQLADDVRSLLAEMIRDAKAKTSPATLVVKSTPKLATVIVDGTPIGPTDLEVKVYAGTHTLRVEKDGYPPVTKDITIKDGERLELVLPLGQSEGPPSSGSRPTKAPPPSPSSIAPWLVIGGGAVLAIGGGVMIARDEGKVQNGTSTPKFHDRSPEDIVFTAAGAVALTVGVVWLWKSHRALAVAPAASVSSGGAALGITGTF